MPDATATVETPGEKVMRQWYLAKLAERLIQATSIAQNCSLLRRGAKKMQDGMLGTSDRNTAEEEPVNINIGDQYINQAVEAAEAVATVAGSDWLKKALVSAALVASGVGAGAGIPWLAGMFDKPAAVEAPTFDDTNTQYELSIKP